MSYVSRNECPRRCRKRRQFPILYVLLLVFCMSLLLFPLLPEEKSSTLPSDSSAKSRFGSAAGYLRLSDLDYPIWEGTLVLVNGDAPWSFPTEQPLVSIYDHKTENYFVRDKDVLLHPEAMDSLNRMMEAFYAETGNSFINVVSGYRSLEHQRSLYSDSLQENGPEYTARYVADPGYSEHHTGLAVDFALYFPADGSSGDFDGTGDQLWFYEHAAEYGFIRRYAEDKETITGIADEPWHFRYVGEVHADYMSRQNLCLEEYLEFLQQYTWDGVHLITEAFGTTYEIYTCPAGSLYVPPNGDHIVSGNGVDGYIVTLY